MAEKKYDALRDVFAQTRLQVAALQYVRELLQRLLVEDPEATVADVLVWLKKYEDMEMGTDEWLFKNEQEEKGYGIV